MKQPVRRHSQKSSNSAKHVVKEDELDNLPAVAQYMMKANRDWARASNAKSKILHDSLDILIVDDVDERVTDIDAAFRKMRKP